VQRNGRGFCAVAGFGIGGVSQVVNKGYPKTQADGCDNGSCAMAGFGICCVQSSGSATVESLTWWR
jgi:hypothetical protein